MRNLYLSRFRLFHKGYRDMVRYILEKDGKDLIIGIGASQRSHYLDNPFTGEEREEMIAGTLRDEGLIDRVSIVQIDETNIGYENWTSLLKRICPRFDLVYYNSDLVRLLCQKSGYEAREVPRFKRREYSFDFIKERIIDCGPWEDLVPDPAVKVIKAHGLDERLRRLQDERIEI